MRSNRPLSPGRTIASSGGAVAALAVLLLLLTGCVPPGTSAGKTPSPSSAASTAPEAAAPPALHPDGTAEENLPFFRSVVQQVWAGEQRGSSRAYVDALVGAGFNRADMQVTKDVSTVDNPAESMQVSVRWGAAQCLIGQVGPSTGEPVATVMSQLAGGRCLIGETLPIDW